MLPGATAAVECGGATDSGGTIDAWADVWGRQDRQLEVAAGVALLRQMKSRQTHCSPVRGGTGSCGWWVSESGPDGSPAQGTGRQRVVLGSPSA